MKKVIAYYRISTKNQEDNTSIENQKEKVKAYCDAKDLQIVAEFEDIKSGANCDRKGYQASLDYLEENQIDAYIVYKIDRVHRHQTNLLVFVDDLKAKGISFISMTEDFNTSTSVGQLMLSMLAMFAQFEKDTIVTRLKTGKAHKLSNLEPMESIGGTVPRGYKNDYTLDKDAPIISSMFNLYIKYKSYTKVCRHLKNENNYKISVQSLKNLLMNRSYIGEYSFQGTTVKDHHEALTSSSIFGKVQKLINR